MNLKAAPPPRDRDCPWRHTMRSLVSFGPALALVVALEVGTARAQFVEPGVSVLHTLQRRARGELFGWAVTRAHRYRRRRRRPTSSSARARRQRPGPFAGRVYVYSGRTGELLYRLERRRRRRAARVLASPTPATSTATACTTSSSARPARGRGPSVRVLGPQTARSSPQLDGEPAGDFFGFVGGRRGRRRR